MKKKSQDPVEQIKLFRQLDQAVRARDLQGALQALRQGANPNHAPQGEDDTPLMVASQDASVEIVQALLEAGANPRAKQNLGGRGRCVLEMALEPNTERAGEVVELLIRAGASPWGTGSSAPVELAITPARPWALLGMLRAGVDFDREGPKGQEPIAKRLKSMPALLARLRAQEIREALAEPAGVARAPKRI